MRIIDITHPPKELWVGRESENRFRPVSFECANWFEAYPNATIVAYYQPYATSDPYPLVLTADGTKRIWHPTATELVKGNGELQIVLMLGNVVGTSAIIPTRVDRSLISSADHPADEAPSWAVEVVLDVEEAASHYPKIVNGVWYVWSVQAEDFVSTGIEAQGEDGYSPTVTVTEIEGGHRVTITDATGAHTFDVMDGEGGSGGGAVESVNGKTGVVVLDASDVGALPDDTPIPAAVTEQTVAGWGFTKNTGTYSKPSGGIPASDLAPDVISEDVFVAVRGTTTEAEIREAHGAGKVVICVYDDRVYYLSDVQTVMFSTAPDAQGKVYLLIVIGSRWSGITYNLALKSDIPSLSAYRTASAQDAIDAAQNTAIAAKYTKPSGGIPTSDLASGVIQDVIEETVMVVHLTPTSADLSGTMDKTGFEILAAYDAGIRIVAEVNGLNGAFEWNQAINGSMVTQFLYGSGGNRELIQVVAGSGSSTAYSAYHIAQLPTVTASDNGKFLRVVNGAWAAETVQTWQGGSY